MVGDHMGIRGAVDLLPPAIFLLISTTYLAMEI
jgi:hypothetical protein